MIEIELDDGTIAEITTDDPAQAQSAAQEYLRGRGGVPLSQYPSAFAAPTSGFPEPEQANGAVATEAASVEPAILGVDHAYRWKLAVQQSALNETQRADLRRQFGPGAEALSDEALYQWLGVDADDKVGPGQAFLIAARRAMGDRAWNAFSAAKLRSLGRADPKADFDPAGFFVRWGGLSEVFKAQLGREHRAAIEAIAAAAHRAQETGTPHPLAGLHEKMGGNLVGRWLAQPGVAPAVARWMREVDLASRLPPDRGARTEAIANRTLALKVAEVSGDDPAAIRARLDAGLPAQATSAADDPFERAAARGS